MDRIKINITEIGHTPRRITLRRKISKSNHDRTSSLHKNCQPIFVNNRTIMSNGVQLLVFVLFYSLCFIGCIRSDIMLMYVRWKIDSVYLKFSCCRIIEIVLVKPLQVYYNFPNMDNKIFNPKFYKKILCAALFKLSSTFILCHFSIFWI